MTRNARAVTENPAGAWRKAGKAADDKAQAGKGNGVWRSW